MKQEQIMNSRYTWGAATLSAETFTRLCAGWTREEYRAARRVARVWAGKDRQTKAWSAPMALLHPQSGWEFCVVPDVGAERFLAGAIEHRLIDILA